MRLVRACAFDVCTAVLHLCVYAPAVAYVNRDLDKAEVKKFKDGEISVKISKNVRGNDAFVVQVSAQNPHPFAGFAARHCPAVDRTASVRALDGAPPPRVYITPVAR